MHNACKKRVPRPPPRHFLPPHIVVQGVGGEGSPVTPPEGCGMLVVDGGRCFCFVYQSPFDLSRDFGAAWLLDVLKLPSRIVRFAQMKYTTAPKPHADAFFRCEADEAACAVTLPPFSRAARMLKWGWFAEEE